MSINVRTVYIASIGCFLPGEPVGNDQIEDYIGLVNGKPSRSKNRVLKANGIKTRHYAFTKTGQLVYSNEQMAAIAIENTLAKIALTSHDIDLLTVGTTLPDALVPGFASQVHGRLSTNKPIAIVSHSGVCCSGVAAMQTAWLALVSGQYDIAVAAASELSSRIMRAERFEQQLSTQKKIQAIDYLSGEFLRFMLSDGAGAMVLAAHRPKHTALRIEWIELRSYAHLWATCMYMGLSQLEHVDAYSSWLDNTDISAVAHQGLLTLKQDTKSLAQNICKMAAMELSRIVQTKDLDLSTIDHFLMHFSSYYFLQPVREAFNDFNVSIPEQKWFTNLATKGNTGSASIYIMLEEAFNEGHIKPGDKVLLGIPESGRFSMSYALLTCI